LRRALRIIQHQHLRRTVEIEAWISSFEHPTYNLPPTDELNISCALSVEAVGIARRLIETWTNPNESTQTVRQAIADQLITT
jgi:hypothetical protein